MGHRGGVGWAELRDEHLAPGVDALGQNWVCSPPLGDGEWLACRMEFTSSSPWRAFPTVFRILLLVGPAIALVGAYALYLIYLDGYLWATGEDRAVEWATVVAYLSAVVVAGVLVPRWWRTGLRLAAVAYVILCVGFFFIAGEEISWGQRILGFEGPPALVDANLQDEANLHNLLGRYALHALYIVIGLWGIGLGRWVVRRVRWLQPWYAFAPSKELFWWFLPAVVYYAYVDYVIPAGQALGVHLGEGPPRLQEPVELLLGLGFLLFVVEAWLRSRGSRQTAVPVAHAEGRTA